MADEFWLYSRTVSSVPEAEMEFLALEANLERKEGPGGLRHAFDWGDLKVVCTQLPPGKAATATAKLCGVVAKLTGNQPTPRARRLLRHIERTSLVLTVSIDPGLEERSRAVLEKLSDSLRPIVFSGGELFDGGFKVLLDRHGPGDARLDKSEELEPLEASDEATLAQVARADRSRAILRECAVPKSPAPLYVPDDSGVTLRDPAEVARRVLVLYTIARAAEGAPRDGIVNLLQRGKLWDAVSPIERNYLEGATIDHAESHRLMWRYEAVWLLLWALGKLDSLPWPSQCCNLADLETIFDPLATDPEFIDNAQLRPLADVLDQRDLMLRLHWAVRNEFVNGRAVPFNLDWSGEFDLLPVSNCPAVRVVEQRHYALSWLCRASDWDAADAPA